MSWDLQARRASEAGLLLLPAAATLYLGFRSGGFFPTAQALTTVLLLVALATRIAFEKRPFAGLGRAGGLAIAALAGYGLWVLASGWWSDSPGRALLELNRVLPYLAALSLYATWPRDSERMTRMVWALALAFAVVACVGLFTRLLPDTFPTEANLQNNRLSYPLTYWNALGLLAGFGALMSLHLACRTRGPIAVRVLGAAAVPILAATLFFTFSRGAIVAAVIGLAAYLLVGRPRGMVTGLVAVLPFTAILVKAAYDADALATTHPTTATATAQGHDLAWTLGLCTAGVAIVRLLLVAADRRIARARTGPTARLVGRSLAGLVALAILAAGVVAGAPGYIDRQYDRFAHGDQTETGGDLRKRLTDPASPARRQQWRVAVREFRRGELAGSGAGTYELAWQRERPTTSTVVDAHSIYLEVAGELGLVGLLLLGVTLATILACFLVRSRGVGRSLYAVLFASGLMWALHAAVDWDWEMPAVSLWLFALGGLALAKPRDDDDSYSPRPVARLGAGLAVLALTSVPAIVALSEARLSEASDAVQRNDCTTAMRKARSSISALSRRPEPYEILGYCEIRQDRPRRAIRSMRKAVDLDPESWSYHYGLALARGALGLDPRREAATARRLNPREPRARRLVRRFRK